MLQVGGLLTVQHSNGPSIDGALLGATGSNAENQAGNTVANNGSVDYSDLSTATETPWDEMSAGNSFDIWINSDDTITLVWTSDDGSTSATLQTYDGPDA